MSLEKAILQNRPLEVSDIDYWPIEYVVKLNVLLRREVMANCKWEGYNPQSAARYDRAQVGRYRKYDGLWWSTGWKHYAENLVE